MSNPDLERHYRLLLAAYPWEHRRVYEEEMLSVLLASARPDQRRPGVADVWNLLAGALRVRFNSTGRGFGQPAWVDAAAVTGLLIALALLSLSGRALTEYLQFSDASWQREAVDWARFAGWMAVCVAVLVGWRWPGAVLAWIAAVAEGASLTLRYDADPVSVVNSLWQVALTLIAAAALSIPAPRRRALAVLGARRLSAIMAAAAIVKAVFLSNQLNRPPEPSPGQTQDFYVFYDLAASSEAVVSLYMAGLAAACLISLISVASLTSPLRWRVGVLLAPAIALITLINVAFAGWMTSNSYWDGAIYLQPTQWAALIGVPLVTFLIGVLAVQRRDHILKMVALGRAVDRQHTEV